jgi:sulfide:quinone oxidoreductase
MSSFRPHRVIVAGGGFAAVEALLALRALAEERVTLELIASDSLLRYRPSATGEPFGADEVVGFELAELAGRAGAAFRRDAVTAVLRSQRAIRLASGQTRGYDSLVLALGARGRTAIPGALTFRDQRDVHHLRRVLDELAEGSVRRVVFAAPPGVAWTLPLYELALMTARHIEDEGLAASVALVTPERRPLEVFGRPGSAAVGTLLTDHGVHLICDALPRAVTRDGLELRYDGTVAAERVIAVPQLAGPRLPGVPADWNGFIATDRDGRVGDVPGVYAAGDLTTFPVKQGGLATQQADAAAAAIAAAAGAPAADEREPYVLRARLLGADEPLYLRAELDHRGLPVDGGGSVGDELPWWPSGKVIGRHLSGCLAELAPAGAPAGA